MNSINNNYIFRLTSIIAFTLSLFLDCVCGSECLKGWSLLLFDWSGIPIISWFANIFLLLSWLYFISKPKTSLILSVIAFVLGGSFLLFGNRVTHLLGDLYHKSSQDHLHPQIGYWIWLVSMLLILVGNLVSKTEKK